MSTTCAAEDPGRLLELAAGRLPAREAQALRDHAEQCAACREQLRAAESLASELVSLRTAEAHDEAVERVWERLSGEAAAAAERARRGAAWSLVLQSRPLRLAAAAAVVLAVGGLAFALLREEAQQPVGAVPAHAAEAAPAPVAAADPPRAIVQMEPVATEQAESAVPVRALLPRRGPNREPGSRPGEVALIEAPAPAIVKLACGAQVSRGQAAELRVDRDEQHIAVVRLDSGRVSMRVPHLPAGGRVEVVTRDARVQVKGTRFSVEKHDEESTTVSVAEGTVWVYPAGRNREMLVLGVGETRTVLGEGAYLGNLLRQVDQAITAGNLDSAERLARRYLEVASRPEQADPARLRLAGLLDRLGRVEDAERAYRAVVDGSGAAIDRQNALALLASLLERNGRAERAAQLWKEYFHRFPDGIHAREALVRLVRHSCTERTPEAMLLRAELTRRQGGDAAIEELLRRCEPEGAR